MIKKLQESLKIPAFAAFLALLIAVFAVIFANITYHPKPLVKRGFEIQLSADGKPLPKKEVKPVDIQALMKIADLKRGKKIFKKCASCHTINKGAASKVGPNLYNVIGRQKASFAGFNYSDALKAKGGSWNIDSINAFLTKPKDYVPGTKMAFPGLKKPQDRADVLLYLEAGAAE